VKQAMFAFVNHARIRLWNKQVLSNTGQCYCSMVALQGLELTTDRTLKGFRKLQCSNTTSLTV